MAETVTATTLGAYLSRSLKQRFRRGQHDCVMFAAGWVRAVSGRDPTEGLPAYATRCQADALIAASGGLESMMDRALCGIGWRRVDAPQRAGDVVLAVTVAPDRVTELAAAIAVDGDRVAFVSARGLVVARATVHARWRRG